MLGFAESFLSWSAATFAPAFLALLAITWAGKRVSGRYLAAFALGIFFWFFVDTILAASTLDVNSGFTGGAPQADLVALFLIGLLLVFWIDRNRDIFSPQSAVGRYGLAIPLLVAFSIAIHGLGEGAAFGGTAYSTTSTSLLDAFGGVSTGVSYLLHKGLEPTMIGACYSVYLKGQERKGILRLGDLLLLAIVFVIPSLLGAATGYFLVYEATFFFALGTGTSIYAAIRLVGPLFVSSETATPWMPMKLVLSLALGFMAIYFAALFHS
jgi:hypothetical protein